MNRYDPGSGWYASYRAREHSGSARNDRPPDAHRRRPPEPPGRLVVDATGPVQGVAGAETEPDRMASGGDIQVASHSIGACAVHSGDSPCTKGSAAPGSQEDLLIAVLRRVRHSLRAGWLFNAGLAERMPRAYFSGWSL